MATAHRPDPGRAVPTATYRLQVHAGVRLRRGGRARGATSPRSGVSHLYLSPVLQAAPGSTHGYDVLDHTRISRGGRRARGVPAARRPPCREAGLGIIVDVVPNHMTVPEPTHLNAPFWSVLRDGRRSPYAGWFDVDWVAEDGAHPDAGARRHGRAGARARRRHPRRRRWARRARVGAAPLRRRVPGRARHRDAAAARARRRAGLPAVELARGRRGPELPALLRRHLARRGAGRGPRRLHGHPRAAARRCTATARSTGFRIDHPDGLADPGGYLERLADATGDAWVVVEKILEGEERLPDDWRCAGTTGYDALLRVQQVLTSTAGVDALDRLLGRCRARPGRARRRRRRGQAARRRRRPGSRGRPPDAARAGESWSARTSARCVVRWRRCSSRWTATGPTSCPVAGSTPSRPRSSRMPAARARGLLAPSDHDALDGRRCPGARHPPAAGPGRQRPRRRRVPGPLPADLRARDGQGHRGHRLLPLVPAGRRQRGGRRPRPPVDPGRRVPRVVRAARHDLADVDDDAVDPRHQALRGRAGAAHGARRGRRGLGHAGSRPRAAGRAATAPRGSTGRPSTSSGRPWSAPGRSPGPGSRSTLLKAVREAKVHTAWIDGDAAYEDAVVALRQGRCSATPPCSATSTTWTTAHEPSVRANVLSQKLVQLTMPGVPDVYQGMRDRRCSRSSTPTTAARSTRPTAASGSPGSTGGRAGLSTSTTRSCWSPRARCGVRRDLARVFVGEDTTYAGLPTTSEHAWPSGAGTPTGRARRDGGHPAAGLLARPGGFGDATVALPGRHVARRALRRRGGRRGGGGRLADLLAHRPVALLVRQT